MQLFHGKVTAVKGTVRHFDKRVHLLPCQELVQKIHPTYIYTVNQPTTIPAPSENSEKSLPTYSPRSHQFIEA